MNRRHFIRNISAGAAVFSIGLNPLKTLAGKDIIKLTILHTNDMHCHIEPFVANSSEGEPEGGMARISGLVKKFRAENSDTLLFDGGDMFQGTPYYNYFKGSIMTRLMSQIGYNAGTIGNHEFDDGLEGILEALPDAKFPLINSNYDFTDTILAGKIKPYDIFKVSGLKIGVYGLGIELKGLVAEKNYGKTIFDDPLQTALKMESFLRNDKKCDLVICLSHLGYKYRNEKISDQVLAAETINTDLIIGGHTHTYLEKPEEMINKAGKKVIINQASWGGLVLGKIDFVFEAGKKNPELVTIQNIEVKNEA